MNNTGGGAGGMNNTGGSESWGNNYGGPDQVNYKTLQRSNAKLRVKVVSMESEIKRLAERNHQLQEECLEKHRKLDFAQKNFRNATHRNWHINSK